MWPNSERQLSLVEGGIRHLVDAVATGRASKAVFDELYKEEVVKKGLAEQLADVDPADAGCFGGEGGI